ncbi:MAG: alanine/ornithine racemase family PLP-dependent enzyme [Anaerovoracaceae bacterium]
MDNLEKGYPMVEVDLKKLRHNIDKIVDMCKEQGIDVAGVFKGFNGLPPGIKTFEESECTYIGSSRLDQIEAAIKSGIRAKPYMLIRVPMMSEVKDVIRLTDISLNSEVAILRALNEEARAQAKVHKVILMVDLGDLREGFWDKGELLEAALMVENDMANLELAGIGTNLGCYGSVVTTVEKMEELIRDGENIEEAIGRKLEIFSGGTTLSLPLVMNKTMPARINNLRIGEGIILAKDLKDLLGYDMSFLYQDIFTLKAEVIEVKNKPSHPVGELAFDAFGNVRTYEDRGIRKRALLGLGKVDFAFPEQLYPRDVGVEILGASSDHLIIDIQDSKRSFQVGDIMEFDLCYATLVYVTNTPGVRIVYK